MKKLGSPDNDPSVRLVINMKPVNPRVESPGYPMDGSSNIMRRLEPGKYRFTCLPQGLVCSTDFFNLLTGPDRVSIKIS